MIRNVLLTVVALGLLGACGGSSSETPWPVEPDDVDLSPEDDLAQGAAPASGASAAPPDAETEPAEGPSNSAASEPDEDTPLAE